MKCEHSEDTLLCSCGFSRVEDPQIEVSDQFLQTWGGLMNKDQIQREWRFWSEEVRDAYVFYRDIAIEYSDDRVLCANFAADRALAERRLRELGSDIAEEKQEVQSALF